MNTHTPASLDTEALRARFWRGAEARYIERMRQIGHDNGTVTADAKRERFRPGMSVSDDRAEARRLRAMGATYRSIATIMDCSTMAAWEWVNREDA